MILQSLYEYYVRKEADSELNGQSSLTPSGWERKEIPFILVIDSSGQLVSIEDQRDENGKRAKAYLVPQAIKKTSAIAANLFWDNPEYVLGYVAEGKKAERIHEQHQAFIQKIRDFFPNHHTDIGIEALLNFLIHDPLTQAMALAEWKNIEKASKSNLSFRLSTDTLLICQRPIVMSLMDTNNKTEATDAIKGHCLVTGEYSTIARLHPAIKGVFGTQTAGGNIVSFNLDAFRFYRKHQGNNAPISEKATETYTKALNYLLRRESQQKTLMGDGTTLVWWAEQPEARQIEEDFWLLFVERDNPDKRSEAIRSLLKSPWNGSQYSDSENTKFFILGLAPNAARIAIRFFRVATVTEFGKNISAYFKEIALPHFEETSFPSISSLCAAINDLDRLPANFQGRLFESIISGTPYPKLLFHSALHRIRATRFVTHNAAAILKACLIRNFPNSNYHREVLMTLQEDNRDIGYVLGQLFSIYDKLKEEETDGRANRRDKFFSALSTRPCAVISRLEHLSQCDLKKLRRSKETRGLAITREKQIQKAMSKLAGPIPPTLSVEQQAMFALGYYHQRQDFFTSKTKPTDQEDAA
ncbi:MAG: type I-C CRISPR-associated protein Cas8c/Csd1 [Alphaproteobacteria bacterium]|nr:type I-C CRISPR-associated protein Cas8c/Csd1 [Alphaproteobacteria bacterium]